MCAARVVSLVSVGWRTREICGRWKGPPEPTVFPLKSLTGGKTYSLDGDLMMMNERTHEKKKSVVEIEIKTVQNQL